MLYQGAIRLFSLLHRLDDQSDGHSYLEHILHSCMLYLVLLHKAMSCLVMGTQAFQFGQFFGEQLPCVSLH